MTVKYFKIAAFLALLEYQVFFGGTYYSPITTFGIMCLCLLQLYNCRKGFSFTGDTKKMTVKVSGTSRIVVLIHVLAVLVGIFVLDDFSDRLFFLLTITVMALLVVSMFETRKKTDAASKEVQPNKMGSFTIPIMFIYMINHLLSVQIHSILAFQFILITSALVLFDILSIGNKYARQYENGIINTTDFRHYLFHRWSKYLNYFLGIWYFITLQSNGIVDRNYGFLLIFIFTVIFLTFTFRMITRLEIKEFVKITILAFFLTGLDPLLYTITGMEMAPYLRAMVLFLFFDLYDVYIHSKIFVDPHFPASSNNH